ncbi:hypothetical protein HanIR_Chr16g0800221 [Helianthus annuus]|nr:hypothetical protein HanIR_Chr16g0800221 [Helianthus annuus]
MILLVCWWFLRQTELARSVGLVRLANSFGLGSLNCNFSYRAGYWAGEAGWRHKAQTYKGHEKFLLSVIYYT